MSSHSTNLSNLNASLVSVSPLLFISALYYFTHIILASFTFTSNLIVHSQLLNIIIYWNLRIQYCLINCAKFFLFQYWSPRKVNAWVVIDNVFIVTQDEIYNEAWTLRISLRICPRDLPQAQATFHLIFLVLSQ